MWVCERLNAKTMLFPCTNRRSLQTFACVGCTGAIKEVEEDMSKILCNIKGCNKWAQIKGLCKAHAHGTEPRKVAVKPVVEPVVDVAPVVVCQPVVVAVEPVVVAPVAINNPPVVSGAESVEIGYLVELRQAFDVVVAEWQEDLQQAMTHRAKAERFINMIKAVEGLGY